MLRSPLPVLSLLLISMCAHAANIPGTSVDITPPAGFEAAKRFAGYINEKTGASIAVSEIPGPFAEVVAGFADAARMQAQGMTLVDKTDVEVAGGRGLLIEVTQSAYGVEFSKWLLAVERVDGTVLIVGSYPQEHAAQYREPLRKTLLATAFGPASDPLTALTFQVVPQPPLAVARVIGQNLILAPGGQFPVQDEQIPFMVVGASVARASISDRQRFAEFRIRQVASVDEPQVGATEPVRIAGLDGLRTLATGTGKAAGTPLTVYQVILFDQSGYYLVQGLTPSADDARNLALFDTISESFRVK